MENNISTEVDSRYIHLVSSIEDFKQSPRIATAICDICGDKAFACEEVLENQGWGLYRDFQFCPNHEAMI